MSIEPRLDVSELRRLALDAGLRASELDEQFAGVVASASGTTMREARQAAPVYLGEYANSITSTGVQIHEFAGSILIRDRVFTPVPHAIVLEEGRRIGARRPPLGPLRRWVQLQVRRGKLTLEWTGKTGPRGGVRSAAIDAATYFIARAIVARGLPAHKIFDRAGEKGERELDADVERIVADWTRRLEQH